MMKLKVCGMKYTENINAVAELQPDYMGFIFYEQSPRNFEGNIPPISDKIKKTGVFVQEDLQQVVRLAKQYHLDALQLHGNETTDYIKNIRLELKDIEIIKVFGIKDKFDFTVLKPYESLVDYFLFDTKGKYKGGNGIQFNWKLLENYPSETPYFLSGGIGLESIQALKQFSKTPIAKKCFAIDINSKFEHKAGLKSIENITTFKQELKHIKW